MQHRCLLIVLITFATNASPACAQQSVGELRQIEQQILRNVQQMRDVTVGIRVGTATASGVILDSGFVLTAGHAVEKVGQPATIILLDGSRREASVHGIDRQIDVAVLKLARSEGLKTTKLTPRNLTTAEMVVAVGNPFGFDPKRPALVRLGRAVGADVIQSSCRIARGDSGGPLFDLQGRLIGVHRQILRNQDANFHTSASVITKSLTRLLAGETIEGETARPVFERLPTTALVTKIGSEVAVDVHCDRHFVCRGTIVDGPRGLVVVKASALKSYDKVLVYRTGSTTKIQAKVVATDRKSDLALLKAETVFAKAVQFQSVRPKIGQVLISVSDKPVLGLVGAVPRSIPQQRGVLGLQADDSLVVTSVQPNSAASAGGVRVGDTLLELDGTRIGGPADLGKSLTSMNAGDRLRLTVQRADKPRTLSVQLQDLASQRYNDTFFLNGAGGTSNLRRTGFPSVIQHDARLTAEKCVGPVMTLDGKFAGINIARVGREAVLMVPANVVQQFVEASSTAVR